MRSNDDYPACSSAATPAGIELYRASMAGPSNVDFRDWVKKNGGDDTILVTLAEFGFSNPAWERDDIKFGLRTSKWGKLKRARQQSRQSLEPQSIDP